VDESSVDSDQVLAAIELDTEFLERYEVWAASRKSGGDWLLPLLEDVWSKVPESEWETLPPDLALNVDHYLYGIPKVEVE